MAEEQDKLSAAEEKAARVIELASQEAKKIVDKAAQAAGVVVERKVQGDLQRGETTNAVLAQKMDSFKELVDTKFKNVEVTLKRIEDNSLGFASKSDLSELKQTIEKNYVTKDQFSPVRNVVFGIVGVILFGVIGALLTVVIIKH